MVCEHVDLTNPNPGLSLHLVKIMKPDEKDPFTTTARMCPFEVVAVGTMSAGKSTLLNALIGQELLHVANLATTACVTRIEHQSGLNFVGLRYGDNDALLEHELNLKPEIVSAWNAAPDTHTIELRGPFNMLSQPATGLVLYDTPGPNNSQNARHRQAMRRALRTIPFHALCYVMNAQHPGTDDDLATLELLREEVQGKPEHKIWFILNKADSLDPEKGESIAKSVSNTAEYLGKAGFSDPIVIPTIAHAALYAKKAMHGQHLTRTQRYALQYACEFLQERSEELMHAALVPAALREYWNAQLKASPDNSYQHLLAASGITAAEALLCND